MYKREFGTNSPVGRDRFASIVDHYGLKVRKRVRAPKTTDSKHNLPLYPDLVKAYIPTAPGQLIVSDITYIAIGIDELHYKFCYLSLVLDAYTKEIVGWSVGETLSTRYPLEALQMALERIESYDLDTSNLIHHSDRGCQYASREYINVLKEKGVRISMTESGNPKDNAQAERINSTMKNEMLKDKTFRSVSEVEAAVAKAVEFYNNHRPHMSINMMTPAEARQCNGPIKKHWHSYRDDALSGVKSEKSLLHAPYRGFLSGYALQSTPVRVKE